MRCAARRLHLSVLLLSCQVQGVTVISQAAALFVAESHQLLLLLLQPCCEGLPLADLMRRLCASCLQALADGHARRQRIAAAASTQGGSSPAPAVLERAVPRILTDDGRLLNDGATGTLTATAAQACGVTAGRTQHELPLTALPPAASQQSAAAAASPGHKPDDALQLAKQRALAYANALSGGAEQPLRPQQHAAAGAAHAQVATALPEQVAVIPPVQVGVSMPVTAHREARPVHGDVPPQQQQAAAGTAGAVIKTASGAAKDALARLLSDYADAEDA